jgi:hypothetical protein
VNWRKILALAFFLAALAAAIAWVNRQEKQRPVAEEMLLDIPGDAVEKIELRNNSGRFVFFRRDTLWYLEEPLATRADKVALESILDNFCQLKYDRLVAEDSRDLQAFGLDNPEIELKLFAAGRPAASVLLGVKNGLDDSSYARLAGQNKVVSLAAYKRNDLEKELFAFRDKKFLAIDAMSVNALDLRYEKNHFFLARKDDRWFLETPVYSLASAARIDDLLTAASTLEALSFAPADSGDGFGLDKPLLLAEFRGSAGSRRIAVGKKGDQIFARVEGAAEVSAIAPGFLEKFAGDASAWREKKVALFYAYDVRELSLRRGTFQFSVRKDAAGNWQFAQALPGKRPGAEKVDALLTALADLEAGEFIDTPGSLPGPAIRVVLRTQDQADPNKQSKIVLEFQPAAGETLIVRNPALPYAFKVGKGILDKFPGKLEDLLGETAAVPGPGSDASGKIQKVEFN